MSYSSYLVGNRVYNGASNAPTRGTVDPMGYIDRGINMISQKRSGLAAAALKRLQGGQSQPQPYGPGNDTTRLIETQANKLNGPKAPMSGSGISQGATVPRGPGLQVSPTGKLNPAAPQGAAAGATGLPYDVNAADSQEDLMLQKSQFENSAINSENALRRQFGEQRRSVQDQLPDARRRLLEDYGSRGLAYSSGYSYDQEDQQSQFAKMLSSFDQGEAEGLQGIGNQRRDFEAQYGTQLARIQREAARRLAEQAGQLGLGGEQPSADEILQDLFNQPGNPQEAAVQPFTPSMDAPNLPGGVDSPFRRPGADSSMSSPAPTAAPASTAAPKPAANAPRALTTFDSKSRTTLSLGGTVVGGNGMTYKLDPITGQAVVVQ